MANQINPNTFAMMCRVPLRDAAAIRKRAEKDGLTVNAYMSAFIHDHVKDDETDVVMDEWIKEHYELNLAKRAKVDELTAAGAYRAKHPKKRGRPPKAKKRGRPAKKTNKDLED